MSRPSAILVTAPGSTILDVTLSDEPSSAKAFDRPIIPWEKPLDYWQMVDVGVRSSYVAAEHAAHIMVPQKSGLIVPTSGYAGVSYIHSH